MDYPWVTVTESSASDWLEVVKTFEPIRLRLFGMGHTHVLDMLSKEFTDLIHIFT